ncbi:hypothetical protein V8D89_015067 [Ganoderma adspersum]
MTEPTPAPYASPFNLLQLPRDVQLLMLLAFDIRELVICKRMCRVIAELVNGDVSIQTKVELARSGRIAGRPSVAVTVADRLTSLRERRARTLNCFIYSLSKGRPHPNASQSHISFNLASQGRQSDYWDSILVLGDLIAWNVPNLNGRRCQMRVINWKTGITTWDFHHELWSRCRLISQSHVVVVAFESLLVYPIDRHIKSPAVHSTNHTALCILQLPTWSSIGSSRSFLVESYIQFPLSIGPTDRPLYCHDPDLTLLTLEIHYIVDIPEHEPQFVQYAMFIPISIIKTHVELTTGSPPPPDGPPHAIPWNDWGPAGTRIVRFDSEGPCRFSPMGGSCAVTHQRRDASGNLLLRVHVFDVHPWATPDVDQAEEQRRFLHITELGTLAGREFTESLQTTFPFNVTRKDIPLTGNDRYPTVVLVEDGLLLVTSPV